MKVLDTVILLEDKPENNLLGGQVGTIVEVLAEGVFEVEFSDENGKTQALLAIPTSALVKQPAFITPYMDSYTDVEEYLSSLTPDKPVRQRVATQERLRLALTDTLIVARKTAGMTQQEVAEALGVSPSWVAKLESTNHDHQVKEVVAYLEAVGAELVMAVQIDNALIPIKRDSVDMLQVEASVLEQRRRADRQKTLAGLYKMFDEMQTAFANAEDLLSLRIAQERDDAEKLTLEDIKKHLRDGLEG